MPFSSRFASAFGRHVRDVAGELLLAELRLADLDVELLDVDRGVRVVLHQPLADDDRVLEVVAVPRHERDQHVAAQGQLALWVAAPSARICALLDLLAHLDDRLLVQAGPLVQADELAQRRTRRRCRSMMPLGVDVRDGAGLLGPDDHAAVRARRPSPGRSRRSAARSRSSGTACRCMFEPISARLASSCSRNGISPAETPTICFGRQSMYWTFSAGDRREVAAEPRPMTRSAVILSSVGRRVGRGEVRLSISSSARSCTTSSVSLLVLDLAVRRDEEAVLVDLGVDRQRRDQADVRAFRRLDRADAAVVRDVHVAHLEARPACGSSRPARGPTAAARASAAPAGSSGRRPATARRGRRSTRSLPRCSWG